MSRLDNIADDDDSPTDTYVAYSYLGASTLIKVEYPGVTSGGNALALIYGTSADDYDGFDRFGRVVDQKWRFGTAGTVADRYTYGYDHASNRLYRQNELENTLSELYHANGPTGAYDGLDRLTDFRRGTLSDSAPVDGILDKIDTTVSRVQAWTLDPVGNWPTYQEDNGDGSSGGPDGDYLDDEDLNQTREHNTANEIADATDAIDEEEDQAEWIDPAYDLAGNMTTGPKPGAEATPASTQWYTYDAWNRMVTVSQGATSPGTLVVTYSYDGLHRRIRKTLAVPNPDITQDFYYNEQWQVLEVRKNQATNANPLKQYIWGADYIDSAVVRFYDGNLDGDVDDAGTDNTLYYTNDAQFNVTALVTPDGDVAERYAYDPYGQVTVLNGESGADGDGAVTEWAADSVNASDWDNEILYCGYRHDPETGLYHVRHRYYHPTLGRWTSRDPIRYGDGMNLYQYVRSAPPVHIDPHGLQNRPASAVRVPDPASAVLLSIRGALSDAPVTAWESGVLGMARRIQRVMPLFPHFMNAAPPNADASFTMFSSTSAEFRWADFIKRRDAIHEGIHAVHYVLTDYSPATPTLRAGLVLTGASWGDPPLDDIEAAERLAWAAVTLYDAMGPHVDVEQKIRKREKLHQVKTAWVATWEATASYTIIATASTAGGTKYPLVEEDYLRAFDLLGIRLSCSDIRDHIAKRYRIPKACLPCTKALPRYLH